MIIGLSHNFGPVCEINLEQSYVYYCLLPVNIYYNEKTILTLEDMFQMCILEFARNYYEHLPLMGVSYNNSCHSTTKMASYEALNGRKCQSPLCWLQAREKIVT